MDKLQNHAAPDALTHSNSVGRLLLPRSAFKREAMLLVGLAIATIAILIWRRPDQLLHPYVWDEEGTVFLPTYLHHGWVSLFYPVQGYLLLPSKFIFLVSATLSFTHLPHLTYWLTVAFTFFVVVCVARCPTYLRWPVACAMAVLLIPTDAEVFAVSEYAFWWGTVLVLVAVLWRPDAGKTWFRAMLTAFGGVSSPLIVPLTGLFLIRAGVVRTKREYLALGIAIAAATVQVSCLLLTSNISHHGHAAVLAGFNIPLLLEKFFGWFVFWSKHSHVGTWRGGLIGAVVILLLIGTSFRNRRKLDAGVLLVAGCLIIAIVASIIRVPLTTIHPVLAGPRYFFLPYILLAWLFIQATSVAGVWERSLIALLLISALHQTLLYGQRFQDPFNWQAQIHACAISSKPYSLPIQYDGSRATAWHVTLSGSDCRQLMSRSFF